MNLRQNDRNHMVDFLFPLALFFVFAISALTVILLAANIYRSTTEHSNLNYTAGTSLAYISEKIHQSDEGSGVSIGTFDGRDALIISQNMENDLYLTYIYADDNVLKELFIKAGASVSASNGKPILEVTDFSMEELKDGLFRFTCTDSEDNSSSVIIGVKSEGGAR